MAGAVVTRQQVLRPATACAAFTRHHATGLRRVALSPRSRRTRRGSSAALGAPGAAAEQGEETAGQVAEVTAVKRGGWSLFGRARNEEAEAPKQYLYSDRFGMPVVREKLSYNELLRDIRTNQVAEVSWFKDPRLRGMEPEGPCLVIYRDGRVRQSVVPAIDTRIPYAMETHSVKSTLAPMAIPTLLDTPPPPPSQTAVALFSKALPVFALLAVYVAATYASILKGDAEDRRKIRAKEATEKAVALEEEKEDVLASEATNMALMGLGVRDICEQLDRLGVPYTRESVEAEVEAAKERNREDAKREMKDGPELIFNTQAAAQAAENKAKKAEEAAKEGGDQMEEAEQFLKMSTVKVQKARTPEQEKIRAKLRAAQRRMKGVKLQYTKDDRVFFDDVAGIGAAKEELLEVVDFFLKPERFKKSGSRIPRGVLLCGPPGTGKTLLARAVAGEAGVAFLSLNASEFVEMFVGVGASRVRDLFTQARTLSPAIIFIDEVDAVGRIRGGASGNDERDQTLNQMLSEMDGFDAEAGVIVMAATNRKDVLDPALIRPGRFDRIIYVDRPDYNGRIEVFKVHLSKRPCDDDILLGELAFETQRFSGAQIANLVNTAAMLAGRDGRESIAHADLENALDLERLGPARKPYSEPRRRRMALQEGATALLATLMPSIEPVLSVSIIPREKYPMGQTILKVNEARELNNVFTRRYLEEQLLMVMSGRAAEQVAYGGDEVSTINQRRLVLARRIVTKLVVAGAMSDDHRIGPRTVSHPIDKGGDRLIQIVPSTVSGYTHEAVEEDMSSLLNTAFLDVQRILARNRDALDAIVEALLERSTLEGDEIREMVERLACKEDLQARDGALQATPFM